MKTVVILGIRSGTSLMANILQELGVYMGKELRGGNSFNKGGFFENLDFSNLNKAILSATGKQRYNMPSRKEILEVPVRYVYAAWEIVKKHEREPIWGFKTPLACFTLPIYKPVLKNPHYIICSRNVDECAESMSKMEQEWHPKTNFKEVVEEYFSQAEVNVSDGPWISVDYNSMLSGGEREVSRVWQFLGFNGNDPRIKEVCKKVIKPEYRTVGVDK